LRLDAHAGAGKMVPFFLTTLLPKREPAINPRETVAVGILRANILDKKV
jgi:hypothetical protein